jgi:UDP-2,3-diacylglucosamine pyrophosphatase LpxH
LFYHRILFVGDVTHVLSKLIYTLKLFKLKFKDVYYCPGNHELWTKSQQEDETLEIYDSIEKFHYVVTITIELLDILISFS